jgi:hypothetical protein
LRSAPLFSSSGKRTETRALNLTATDITFLAQPGFAEPTLNTDVCLRVSLFRVGLPRLK